MTKLYCLLLLLTATQSFCMEPDHNKRGQSALGEDGFVAKRRKVADADASLVDLCKEWISQNPFATAQMHQMMLGVLAQTVNTQISCDILESIDPMYIDHYFDDLVRLTTQEAFQCDQGIKVHFAKRLGVEHIVKLVQDNMINQLFAQRCLELFQENFRNIHHLVGQPLPVGTESSMMLLRALVSHVKPGVQWNEMTELACGNLPEKAASMLLRDFCTQQIESLKAHGDARWQELQSKISNNMPQTFTLASE